jgi:hypothetical protein
MSASDDAPAVATTVRSDVNGSRAIMPRRRLTGARCRCSACGQHFNSVAAFDMHRVGTYQPIRRICLLPQEMQARGMSVNRAGFWITEARAERVLSRGLAPRSGDRRGVHAGLHPKRP